MSYRKPIKKEYRKMLYNEFGGKCGYCGVGLDGNYHIDHMNPIRKGGKSVMQNYIVACPSCNIQKATLTVEQFRDELIKKHNKLKRDDAKYRALLRYGVIEKKKDTIKFHFEKNGLI